MKRWIQRLFNLRSDVGLNFYVGSFFSRYILMQNRGIKWHVHYTSTVHAPQNLVCGKNVFAGDSPGTYIEATNGIFIGDYTNLGPNVGLISSNHDVIDNNKHVPAPPIKIGAFCWLGMNSVVLPGVELGDFCIVGAGSVVTKSFAEGYCVIAGNPAQLIKQLDKAACERHKIKKASE